MIMQHLIGIDPGNNTGICLYDMKSKTVMSTITVRPWDVLEAIDDELKLIGLGRSNVRIYMEDPRQNRPTFERDSNLRGMRKIAQNVGSNKRDADWLEAILKRSGFEVQLVKPTTTKWTPRDLKIFTGLSIKTNEHVRDAIKLVYGR